MEESSSNSSNPLDMPIHFFKGYKFIHGIILTPPKLPQESLDAQASWFKKAEDVLVGHMFTALKDEKISYNLIGCTKFIMVVPRRAEKISGEIAVNAICFLGSLLVKN
jgi:ATP adenylyltransferase/5',5'''-P-1,P-4-tetraphosphate phosphorylase II